VPNARRSRREREDHAEAKRKYQSQIFEEFDDFFNFSDSQDVSRDDTTGADVKLELELEFLEGINGCERTVVLDKRVMCVGCKGRRADLDQQPRRCYECGGRGSLVGNYGIRKKCPKCEGSGCQVKNAC